jgi:hypothetical protein
MVDLEHERGIVRLGVEAVCQQWGYVLEDLTFPEDEVPQPPHPLDGIAATSGPTIAIEHTLHQSFPNEMTTVSRFRPLMELARSMSGSLPGPGRYQLNVAAETLEGKKHADLKRIESWIRAVAPTLTASTGSVSPTNVASAGPPELPFEVQLLRFECPQELDGRLDVGTPIDLDALPGRTAEEMRRALHKKLPKLEAHRPEGEGRTLLIFENQDIQLPNPFTIASAVHTALDELSTLPPPDAVVVVHAIGDERGLSWVKDGDVPYRELMDRPYLSLPVPPDV